ncbi:Anaphase-promoting complex subunit 1-like protein [Drosera capensis]
MTTTPDPQIGVRHLEVLGEFKPFGLIAEALDGNPIDDAVSEKYDYFLFDPQVVAPRDESDGVGAADDDSGFGDGAEHELFIRGNRIIWTSGSRVLKKLTLKSSAIMACWCRLGGLSHIMLCVLEVGSLTIFDTSGEFTSIPLPGMITSIWPLPFGLLLQQAAESRCPVGAASTSSSLLSSQNTFSSKKELRHSPMQNHGLWNYDSIVKGTLSSTSSHLVLNGLVEEPQNVFVEERGSLNVMHDFDERTIWTSDYVPLMASFNREKMQHSVWSVVRTSTTQREKISSLSEELSPEAYAKQFSLRRIWVAKVSRKAAAKVFLATNDDAVPVICFFLQEQKRLMLVRLSNIENGDDVLIDIKLQISWIESVVAAEPVAVTLSRAKAQGFPVADIIALAPEGVLLLYSGKQCLCKFMLPSCFGRPQVSLSSMPSDCITLPPVKVVGLADATRSRINVILNSGQMLRCSLRRGPPCSLTNDCMKALAAGLCSSMYSRFLRVLWGHDISLVLKHDNYVSYEWKLFSSIIKLMIGTAESSSEHASDVDQYSAWDFLVNSEFHNNYGDGNFMPFRETGNVTDLCFASSTRQEQQSHEKPFYKEFLIECLSSLHAIYENLKLIYTRKRDLELLVVLLFGIADFLGEEKYVEHYVRDFPFLSSKARSCKMVFSQRVAPSLYRWLKNCLMHGLSHTKTDDIPLLVCKEGSSVVGLARKVVAFYSLLSGERCVSKKLASGVYCNVASGSVSCPEEQTVLAMVGEGFGLQQLDLLPVGLSLPLRHALFKCRECPPSDWPEAAYILLGREDLALSCTSKLRENQKPETQIRVKYYSESVPYILQLSPVPIPATMSETFGSENCKLEDADSVDGPVTDGMEHIFNSSIRLRYGRDLRLNEVRCLLSSSRPVPIHACVNSSASEQELQQAQLWQISQRTTALPLGRGAFTLATTCSLLTEALAVPKLVLAGRLPTQQNAMVNLDHNLRNVQDLQVWPEFHNAVAAGLCLAPMQGKMSRTWILYNRSEESSPMHAGLLLALGLHGHLTVLTITDVYRYYQQEYESTTVGLMLGLAASYRGTMELTMSKSFYVHLPSKHPSSFPELEVPTLIQSAALMSLGLLSEGSAHPLTMNYLLGEIGRRSGGDNVLEREGYAVSAGFALGIVVLGLGKDCLPWIESTVDRLFHFAGDRAFRTDTSSLLPIMDESRGSSQVVEGVPVNVDVTAPGAIVALALMFLKAFDKAIHRRFGPSEYEDSSPSFLKQSQFLITNLPSRTLPTKYVYLLIQRSWRPFASGQFQQLPNRFGAS